MLEKFSLPARAVIGRAGDLAAAAGGPRVGTEFLLAALCEQDDTGPVLARHGVTAPAVRAALADEPGLAPPPDERELLAVLGIDLDLVRERVRALSGGRPDPGPWRLRRSPLWPLRVSVSGPGGDLVFTGGGRKALEVALWRARRGGGAPAGPADLLCGLLVDGRGNAARVLARLGADRGALHLAADRPRAA